MEYNKCEICGAGNGRAGNLFGIKGKPNACKNCHDTRETGRVVIHSYLRRTEEEIKKTIEILSPKPSVKCATIHESSGENCPNEGVYEVGIDRKSIQENKPLMVCERCKTNYQP